MNYSHLNDRTIVRISGNDAEQFLENIVTCKVEGMLVGETRFGALLTPQGKILFDFFVYREQDAFLFDLEASLVPEFTKRMTFYKLRAEVSIEPETVDIFAIWGDHEADGFQDSRLHEMGSRLVSNTAPSGTEADYHQHRVSLGVPSGGIDFEYGNAYPHEVLMDQFGGVDFKKGCYVGQEIVSRMQHRGTTKKRIIHISSDTDLPDTGTPIVADGRPVGQVGSTFGKSGLALLRLDRVAKANSLVANDVEIRAEIQNWVNFEFPASENTIDHAQ